PPFLPTHLRFCPCDREKDSERRATVRLAVHADVSACLFDDSICRRQAEAGSLADFLSCEKRLKDVFFDFRDYAVARISHLQACELDGKTFFVLLNAARERCGASADAQTTAFRHRVARVENQIHDHELDLRRIRINRQRIRLQMKGQFDTLTEQSAQHLL